jgi:hypothetical protein
MLACSDYTNIWQEKPDQSNFFIKLIDLLFNYTSAVASHLLEKILLETISGKNK